MKPDDAFVLLCWIAILATITAWALDQTRAQADRAIAQLFEKARMDKQAFAAAASLDKQLRDLQTQLDHLKQCHDPRALPQHVAVPPEAWHTFRDVLISGLRKQIEETQQRFAAL